VRQIILKGHPLENALLHLYINKLLTAIKIYDCHLSFSRFSFFTALQHVISMTREIRETNQRKKKRNKLPLARWKGVASMSRNSTCEVSNSFLTSTKYVVALTMYV
jgi:hypothetical protein